MRYALLLVYLCHIFQIVDALAILLEPKRHQRHIVEEVAVCDPHSLGLDPTFEVPDCKSVEFCEGEDVARQLVVARLRVDVHDPGVEGAQHEETAVLAQELQVHVLEIGAAQILHQLHEGSLEVGALGNALLQDS